MGVGSSRRLRIGLVGCGAFSGAALIPAMRMAPIEIVSVADRDPDRARAARQRVAAEAAFGSLDELLGGPAVDAVMMAVGPTAYPALAVEAMEAGVDVYVEKPPAIDAAGARSMRDASRRTGRQLAVGFMKRFATGYRMASELARDGAFGGVTHVTARISSGVWTPQWAKELTPHAFLFDHSIHALDLMRFLAGPVDALTAEFTRSGPDRFGFAVLLRFKSGATGLLELSNFESRGVPNERVQIMGGAGCSVTVENVSRVTYARDARPMELGRPLDVERDRVIWEPNMTNISPENSSLVHMGYAGEMRNLADCLLNGRPVVPDIEDGLAAVKLAEAVLASDGRRIAVPAD